MKTEKVHNNIRYTFSNENLEVGDKVFPIANGRCLGDKITDDWILHDFDFRDFMSGFPDEPHTILNLHHSEYKPYEVRTDHGYGPHEIYYKIIKKERHIKENETSRFPTYKWVEVEE